MVFEEHLKNAFAQAEKKDKYVVVITHGGDDPNRAIFGLLMAETAARIRRTGTTIAQALANAVGDRCQISILCRE